MAKTQSAAKNTSKKTAKKAAAKKSTASATRRGPTKRGATKRTAAKSAARPKARAGATTRARRTAGAKAGVMKGNLEVGDRRRESGGVGAALPASAAREPRGPVSSAQIAGEKAVPRTDESLPVEPPERDGDDEPMDEAAVDRRRQIIGTDDRRGRRS